MLDPFFRPDIDFRLFSAPLTLESAGPREPTYLLHWRSAPPGRETWFTGVLWVLSGVCVKNVTLWANFLGPFWSQIELK